MHSIVIVGAATPTSHISPCTFILNSSRNPIFIENHEKKRGRAGPGKIAMSLIPQKDSRESDYEAPKGICQLLLVSCTNPRICLAYTLVSFFCFRAKSARISYCRFVVSTSISTRTSSTSFLISYCHVHYKDSQLCCSEES